MGSCLLTACSVLGTWSSRLSAGPLPSSVVPLGMQDRYVPYHSARMEVPQAALTDPARGGSFTAMADASLRALLDAPQLASAAEGAAPEHRQEQEATAREGGRAPVTEDANDQAISLPLEQASRWRLESFTRCSVAWGGVSKRQHLGMLSMNALLGRAAHIGFLESKSFVELFFWEHWEKLLLA